MTAFDAGDNPLRSESPVAWDDLIQAAGPPSLLVVIESRMSAALRRRIAPEDIFQEALLHAWRDRARCEWRGVKAFRSWLLSIIDHRIRDAADREDAEKRGGGRAVVSINTGESGSFSGTGAGQPVMPPALVASTTPSRVAIYREQAQAMRAAIEALPDELREVVRLRLFEQRTIEQIAAQLSLGEAAVRHRFRKGAEAYQRRLTAALASRSHSPAADSAPRPHTDSSSID